MSVCAFVCVKACDVIRRDMTMCRLLPIGVIAVIDVFVTDVALVDERLSRDAFT